MTAVSRCIGEAHAIMRAARRVARGQSADKVLQLADDDVRRWVRNHPATYADMIACERRELAANGRESR